MSSLSFEFFSTKPTYQLCNRSSSGVMFCCMLRSTYLLQILYSIIVLILILVMNAPGIILNLSVLLPPNQMMFVAISFSIQFSGIVFWGYHHYVWSVLHVDYYT